MSKNKNSKKSKSTTSTKTVKSEPPACCKMQVTTPDTIVDTAPATPIVEISPVAEVATPEPVTETPAPAAEIVTEPVAATPEPAAETPTPTPVAEVPAKAKGKPGAHKKNLTYPDTEFTVSSLNASLGICKLTISDRLKDAIKAGTVTRLPNIKTLKVGRPVQRYILTALIPAPVAATPEPEMVAPPAPVLEETVQAPVAADAVS